VSFQFKPGFADLVESISCIVSDSEDVSESDYFEVEDYTISFDYESGDEVYVGVSFLL